MKKKIILMSIALLSSFLLLTGCGKEPVEEGEVKKEYPKNAILPVFTDEDEDIKSTEIELTDFTFTIPDGYTYGKVDYEGYSTYYVWQDKEDKEYSFALDGNVMLYIYEGLDTNSPHKQLTNTQAKMCLSNSYSSLFRNLISAKNVYYDADISTSDDDRYYALCFTASGGEYLTTTYSEICYPRTYYGIFAMEQTTETSDRRWYGFVFSNDAEGEIFKESEYNYMLSQIKTALNISSFYTQAVPGSFNYNAFYDVSNGRSYEQLVGDESGENVGLFYNTLLYYVETLDREYERKNVDVSPVPEK